MQIGVDSIRDCIPHTRSMRLIDLIGPFDNPGRHISVDLIVDPTRFYWDNSKNRFKPAWLIELISQASAALYFNLCHAKGEPASIGYLVGVKHFEFDSSPSIVPGDRLRIHSRLTVDFEPFGVFESQVYLAEVALAHCEMTLYTKKETSH